MTVRTAFAIAAMGLFLTVSPGNADSERPALDDGTYRVATVKTEAELIYHTCFRNKKDIIKEYNGFRRYKAMAGGIRGPEGARRMKCYVVGNSTSQKRANDKAMANCKKFYTKCFLAARGSIKGEWVRTVERRLGTTVSLSPGARRTTPSAGGLKSPRTSDAELLWRSCFVTVTGKAMVGRYNASRTKKALVAGVRTVSGSKKAAKCFSTTKSASFALAGQNSLRLCKEEYPRCYIVTYGGAKRKWVKTVEAKMGLSATVR